MDKIYSFQKDPHYIKYNIHKPKNLSPFQLKVNHWASPYLQSSNKIKKNFSKNSPSTIKNLSYKNSCFSTLENKKSRLKSFFSGSKALSKDNLFRPNQNYLNNKYSNQEDLRFPQINQKKSLFKLHSESFINTNLSKDPEKFRSWCKLKNIHCCNNDTEESIINDQETQTDLRFFTELDKKHEKFAIKCREFNSFLDIYPVSKTPNIKSNDFSYKYLRKLRKN